MKGSLFDQLCLVNVVRRDDSAWGFLGLSLAGYNVLISLGLLGPSRKRYPTRWNVRYRAVADVL